MLHLNCFPRRKFLLSILFICKKNCFQALLASLEKAKSSSATIESSLKESVGLQATLDKERKTYLTLAQAAATLYFVISDLSKQNNMYRFSLTAFIKLFNKALETPKVSTEVSLLLKLYLFSNINS